MRFINSKRIWAARMKLGETPGYTVLAIVTIGGSAVNLQPSYGGHMQCLTITALPLFTAADERPKKEFLRCYHCHGLQESQQTMQNKLQLLGLVEAPDYPLNKHPS